MAQKVVVWVCAYYQADVYDFYNEDSLELLRSDILSFADDYIGLKVFNVLADYGNYELSLQQAIEQFVAYHPEDDVFTFIEIQEVL